MSDNFFTISPPKPLFEVADVFDLFMDDYRQQYNTSHRQEEVIRAIMACRTPEMGGVVNKCDDCGAMQFVFKSCGDSHCPKCGKFRKAEWVARQEILELPVPYFHVTFTTDHAINVLITANQKEMLDAIFWAASTTLKKFGEKYLGGQIGFTAVLHTWGQTMIQHVHVHFIVPGGALSKDGKTYQKSGKSYLFPAEELSAQFRDRLCRRVKKLKKQKKLKLVGAAAEVNVGQMVKEMLAKKWEVYIQAFEEVENLYTYLSRYVHQVAISNHRIINIDRQEKSVTFRYKDNKDGGQEKEMTLPAETFIGRFLWHVLPRGFWRIRHYGLHHGSCRKRLSQARALLGLDKEIPAVEKLSLSRWLEELFGEDVLNKCAHCGGQNMSRHGQYDSFNPAQMELIKYAILNTAKREPAAVA
ncbi:MAG: transposase [Aestuariibacter sp.]|nr:transposase [Aestuariibacter sp.]